MKAVTFDRHGGVEVLQYRDDVPMPKISPNEVLIRIRAAAMNYNCLWARNGLPGMDIIFPHTNGTDGAGVVVAVGSEVTNVKVGDEVLVNGGFSCGICYECIRGEPMFCSKFLIWGFQTGPNDGAEGEYAKAPARHVVRKPPSLSFEGAAAVGGVLTTVWRMLVTRARIRAGDIVLVWGATGGLGSVAIQLVKALKAKCIGIVGSEAKGELASQLGADHIINRKTQNILVEVLRITGERGVDIVLEHSGADSWETSMRSLRPGGTIVTCGATTGFKTPIDLQCLWTKQQNYLGSHYGTTSEMIDCLRFVESGQIKPVIHDVLPLNDIVRGHQILESGDILGKIVLIPE